MSEKIAVQQSFGKNKAGYITSSTHAKGQDLDILIDWLQPTTQMQALDIATGGGHVAKKLAPYVKQVFATDLTKPMLEQTATFLENMPNIEYLIADAEELPFLDERFDLVTCRVAAHHFPHPLQFLKEVDRVLKPGGKFLLIDNIAPEDEVKDQFINKVEKMRDFSHGREYKISEWKNMFTETNLQLIKEQAWKKTLHFDEWANRMIDDPKVKKEIVDILRHAEDDLQNYFNIHMNNDHITSFTIDTWNALYERQ